MHDSQSCGRSEWIYNNAQLGKFALLLLRKHVQTMETIGLLIDGNIRKMLSDDIA